MRPSPFVPYAGRRVLLQEARRSIKPFEHATLVLVAIAYTALAFADGGYSEKLVAGATIGIWLTVSVGIVAGLWPSRRVPLAAILAGGCLAALAILSALSMAWADDAGRAFVAVVRVEGYLGLFALVVLAAPRSGPRAWLNGLAVGLTVVSAGALATRFDPSLFGGGDRTLSLILPTAAGRLSYPIGYWNGLGACVAIGAVLLVWLGTRATSRLGRSAAVGLIPLPILALYLASSRGGFAAALAGGLVLLAFERTRAALLGGAVMGSVAGGLLVLVAHTKDGFLLGLATPPATHEGLVMGLLTLACVVVVGVARYLLDDRLAKLRLPAVRWRVAAPVLVAVAAVAVVFFHPSARSEESGSQGGQATGGSVVRGGDSGRLQFWDAALDAYASRPIAGIGAGNYELYWNAHPGLARPLVNAHSLYLETLAELGVVGLALVLGFLITPAVAGWRRLAGSYGGEMAAALAVLAAGALSAGIEWTWQLPAAFVPVVIAAGLMTAAFVGATTAAPAGADTPDTRSPRRFGLGVATIGIAWASIWTAGILLISDLKLDASRAAAARGDLVQAADDARGAAGIEPWSPEPRLQLALVEELAGNLHAARDAAAEANDRAPGDWRTWAVAARIDARAGDVKASRVELAFAQALSPVSLPADFSHPARR